MGTRGRSTTLLAIALALPLVGLAPAVPAGAATPIKVSVVPGNGRAQLSFTIATKPPIRYLHILAFIGNRQMQKSVWVKPSKRTATFPNLKNGIQYHFRLLIEYKSSLEWHTYDTPKITIGVPLAPTNARAVASGAGAIQVSATAPKANGSPIVLYTATCTSSNGGAAKTGVSQAPAVPSVNVAGLTPGHSYRCVVFAKNAHGRGANSAPSNTVSV